MLGELIINEGEGSLEYLNFYIEELYIGVPEPNIITATIPHKSGYYDFSKVSGELTYGARTIKVKFKYNKWETSLQKLNELYLLFANWIYTTEKFRVSWIHGYFVGGVTSISDLDLMEDERAIEVTFTCQPFRTLKEETLELSLTGSKVTKTVLNSGKAKADLYIVSSTAGDFAVNGKTYSLEANKPKRLFKLPLGSSDISIQGTGYITLSWQEVAI